MAALNPSMVSAVRAAGGRRFQSRLVLGMKELAWASSFDLVCGRWFLVVERRFLP